MYSVYMKFPEGRGKALTFSYDDGVVQDKRLIALFDKYGLKATFNLSSNIFYDRRAASATDWWKPMTLEDAKKLYIGSGHEVALHGHNHPYPHAIKTELELYDVLKNREILEKEFGGIITGMAYPQGTYNDEIIAGLKLAGVSYSRAVKSTHDFAYPPENWLALQPTCHHKDVRVFELAEKFKDLDYSGATNAMFYIWGHSYELDLDNNWDHMEKLCETLSGRDDIWYATNIEIYNYQKAFNSLEISLDGTVIHNPTSMDIWVRRHPYLFHGETVKIGAGETFIAE